MSAGNLDDALDPAGEIGIEHDPAADGLDLLTVLEARARILEELRRSRDLVTRLAGDGSRAAELRAAQVRLENLKQTIERLEHPATPPPDLNPRRRP
jgi:hypothetical protein